MNKVTAFLILLIGLLQYKLWFGEGNVLEFQRLNDRIAEMRLEGAKRRERNAALEAEVMDLKQGLDAVEERARHELGMVMEGEQFVQVIDPQHEQEPAPPSSVEKPEVSNELPEVTKTPKKQKAQEKKKPKEPASPKLTENQPPSAKKPATATKDMPTNQAKTVQKPKEEPLPPPKPKLERPPAKDQQPLFD